MWTPPFGRLSFLIRQGQPYKPYKVSVTLQALTRLTGRSARRGRDCAFLRCSRYLSKHGRRKVQRMVHCTRRKDE